MIPSDLMGDHELTARCDFLCVETITERMSGHPHLVPLPPGFTAGLDRIPVSDATVTALEGAASPDAIVRIARTSGTTGEAKFVHYTQ